MNTGPKKQMSCSVTSLLPGHDKQPVSKEVQAHFLKMMQVKQMGDPSRPKSDFKRIEHRMSWLWKGNKTHNLELNDNTPLGPGDFGLTTFQLSTLE